MRELGATIAVFCFFLWLVCRPTPHITKEQLGFWFALGRGVGIAGMITGSAMFIFGSD